jgi:outer membrane protein assembly factor BamB
MLLVALSAAVPSPVARAAAGADWLTFGDSPQRDGENTAETLISPANAGGLHQIWAHNLGANADNSPVEAAGVTVASGTQNLVLAGSEHGIFTALNAQTGATVWTRTLGTAMSTCHQEPDGIYGITGTAVIDRSTNRVFVADGAGAVYALDLTTGRTMPGWPVKLPVTPSREHVWGALALVSGHLYVPVGGLCDLTPFHGRLVEIDAASGAITAGFVVNGRHGPSGGAIWGWGGEAVDPSTGKVYVATGNAAGAPQNAGLSEAVIQLSGSLAVKAFNKPPLGAAGTDLDFGSTPVLFQAPGCPEQLVAENKNGALYLYDQSSITAGPVQRIQLSGGELIGVAAWSNKQHLLFAANPADSAGFRHGMVAFTDPSPACILTVSWTAQVGPAGVVAATPIVANGVVYYGAGTVEYALNAATGARLWTSGSAITAPIHGAAAVVNGVLYVPSWDHQLHAFAVRGASGHHPPLARGTQLSHAGLVPSREPHRPASGRHTRDPKESPGCRLGATAGNASRHG